MTDIQGNLDDSDYTWAEERGSGGAGPQSMKIIGPGIGTVTYKIDPNPHDNPDYNKNQSKLYEGFAKQINSGWPKKGSSSFKAVKSVDDVDDKKKKAELLALKKDKQKQALDKWNEDNKKTAEETVTTAYRTSVAKHVKGKKGAKFTLGGVAYELT